MKAFSVNKNSWHYRLNIRMVKTNERMDSTDLAERFVQSKDNLCSYWQMTLWSMFKLAVVIAFVSALVFGFLFFIYSYGYALIFHTKEALTVTMLSLAIIGFVVGSVFLLVHIDRRKKRKLDMILYHGETETSLTNAKYSSWKSGVCIPVEFKE